MSRKFIGGSVSDEVAKGYLKNHRQLQQPDLYVLTTSPGITMFPGGGGLEGGRGGGIGGTGKLLGPLHAMGYADDADPYYSNDRVWGYQNPRSGRIYWLLSPVNQGNFWKEFDPDKGCGVPGGGLDMYTSYEMIIAEFDPSLYAELGPDAVNVISLGYFPCSYNSGPDGHLIVADDAFYIGAGSGYADYRWFKSPKSGFFSPCPTVNTWGELTAAFDDHWGGYTHIGYCAAAAWVPSLGLLHVNSTGDCYYFGASAPMYHLPDYGHTGDSISAAACVEGDGPYDSIWVLSNHGSGATADGGYITRFSPTEGIESWPLGASPLEQGPATCIRYYADEGALLCFFGGEPYQPPEQCMCYKWDIGLATIEWSNPVRFGGASGILVDHPPSGTRYYFASDLVLYDAETLEARTDLELDPTGLPDGSGEPPLGYKFIHNPTTWHFWDPVNGVYWCLTAPYGADGTWDSWTDQMVFGLPLRHPGGPPLPPPPPGGGGGGCFTLGKIFTLTDWPRELDWGYRGTFTTAVIKRGEVQSTIGLEADTLEITWSPWDDDTIGDGFTPVLEAFARGLFDNGFVEIWRSTMPNVGDQFGSPVITESTEDDVNMLGCIMLFSGRIGDIKVDGSSVVLTAISRMETLNVEVPTNLVEPTNVYALYGVGLQPGGANPLGETVPAVPASTETVVYGTSPGGTSEGSGDDVYTNGFLVFQCGSSLAGVYARIIRQISAGGVDIFCLEEPLVHAPVTGDIFIPFQQWPLDSSGPKYGGFRWVPIPNNSVVVI